MSVGEAREHSLWNDHGLALPRLLIAMLQFMGLEAGAFRTAESDAAFSFLPRGGMVQGLARQILNLETRVRFPVPLPFSLA